MNNKVRNITLAEHINYLGFTLIHFINKFLGKISIQKKPLILCYHSIEDDAWRFSVHIDDFKKQMKYLKFNRKIVSLDQLTKFKDDLSTAITFDDGYKNILVNALPILLKYNIPATVFVIGEPANANRSELSNNKQLLTITEIKKIHNAGIEIGYHTKTHSNLRRADFKLLKDEITYGKRELESKLGFKIRYFAYPRGAYTKQIIKLVKEAGFECAFTVDNGITKSNGSKYQYSRISLENNSDLDQFKDIISTPGLIFGNNMMSILKIKEELVYRLRYFALGY